MDLLLDDYLSRRKENVSHKLDAAFKNQATPQLRLMFFVGHDSTTSTVCYALYLLYKNKDSLFKIREEHDAVFGVDTSSASAQLRKHPHLINQLPYTTAVIKEALRLFTPASGFRAGSPDVILTGSNGETYPTEDTRIWILHSVLHRNPRYFPKPSSFIPERFLVEPNDSLYPPKGAWRPFEHGPRR